MGSIFLESSLRAVMKTFLRTGSPNWNCRILANFVVAGEKLLLVGCDAGDGLLTLLLCQI